MFRHDIFDNLHCWTFAQIINIWLERKPITRNHNVCSIFVGIFLQVITDCRLQFAQDPFRLTIIYQAGGTNQLGVGGRFTDNEPRVYSDTMAAYTWTRLQYVYARMTISKFD
ncbi:hypothetical protein GT37_08890 [Pseudomonas putida]|nr:hypothetical protein GT37_08890 [Pseudomonas putida]